MSRPEKILDGTCVESLALSRQFINCTKVSEQMKYRTRRAMTYLLGDLRRSLSGQSHCYSYARASAAAVAAAAAAARAMCVVRVLRGNAQHSN